MADLVKLFVKCYPPLLGISAIQAVILTDVAHTKCDKT